jgi:hypothetical protein
MRDLIRKALTLALVAGLLVASPVCLHAHTTPCGSAASHEGTAVEHYADVSVDPGNEASLNENTFGSSHHHDDGFCKKSCAACVGVSLVPAAPHAAGTLTASQQLVHGLSVCLDPRAVPVEPGIPKSL